MLFMVIERFRNGNAKAVYERFLDKGRLMPDGLTYVDSWVTVDSRLCYQLVECEDEALVEEWTREWDNLIQFTVHPVVSGIDAAKDQGIDFSDIPELDDEFWRNAELVEPDRTEQATFRVNRCVLAKKIEEALTALGASPGFLETRRLPMYADAEQLALVEVDAAGRELLLTPPTVIAWQSMSERASHDGVELFVVSAFRSFDQQLEIVKRKLIAGQNWEEILRVSAPPGCSEHHTGRAVDIGTPHCKVLDEEFEQTEAYDWLVRFAGKFGFRLSYPRGNSCGYAYEPWHWCFVKDFPSRPGETSAG